ncbi:MAG: hypothetical protein ABJB11_22410 [Ferruginibacter sp.]
MRNNALHTTNNGAKTTDIARKLPDFLFLTTNKVCCIGHFLFYCGAKGFVSGTLAVDCLFCGGVVCGWCFVGLGLGFVGGCLEYISSTLTSLFLCWPAEVFYGDIVVSLSCAIFFHGIFFVT